MSPFGVNASWPQSHNQNLLEKRMKGQGRHRRLFWGENATGGLVTWVALWELKCAGAILTEPHDDESVWAEPADEGLLCCN